MAYRPRVFIAAFVLVLLMVLGSCSAVTAAQKKATRSFLLEFVDEFKQYQLPTWYGDDYCAWDGVTCAANGEVSVNLSGRGLRGEVPEFDDDVRGSDVLVVSIDLSNNPGIVDDLDDDWKYLVNLRYLDLSNTQVEGDLPDKWRDMRSLETLKIANARICKSLPQWSNAALKHIDLSNNRLTGSLNDRWSRMTSLATVNLGGNDFCGCVPTTWANNAVLSGAVSGYPAVTASDCKTSNRCTIRRLMCDKSN